MTARECALAARLLAAAVAALSFTATESRAQTGAIEEVVVTAATGSRGPVGQTSPVLPENAPVGSTEQHRRMEQQFHELPVEGP